MVDPPWTPEGHLRIRRPCLASRPRSSWAGQGLYVGDQGCSRVSLGSAHRPPTRRPPASRGSSVERVTGIEPALSAWEADVLPLNYTRDGPPVCRTPGHRMLTTVPIIGTRSSPGASITRWTASSVVRPSCRTAAEPARSSTGTRHTPSGHFSVAVSWSGAVSKATTVPFASVFTSTPPIRARRRG